MAASDKVFFERFQENMVAIPYVLAPSTLFETKEHVVSVITAIAVLIQQYGANVTIGELIKVGAFRTAVPYRGTVTATTLASGFLEIAALGAGLYASYYLGACVGSLAVATGEWLADDVAFRRVTSYPLEVAHNTCVRSGLSFPDCLLSSENRPMSRESVTPGAGRR